MEGRGLEGTACYLHVKRSVFWLKFWRYLPNRFKAWDAGLGVDPWFPAVIRFAHWLHRMTLSCSAVKFIVFSATKAPKFRKSTLNYGIEMPGRKASPHISLGSTLTRAETDPPGSIIIETRTEVCRNNRSGFTSNRRASKLLARQLVLPVNTSVNICCGCSLFCTLSESTSPPSLLSAFDRSRRRMTALLRI
jgi:hypothetical protein